MTTTRSTRSFRKSRRSRRGFTLLEVLAALLIAGIMLTYLLQSETDSIRSANRTRDLRAATILAQAKLQELVAGIEGEGAGSFEDRPGWRWMATREPYTGGPGAEKVVLLVHYTAGGRLATLRLEQVAP